MKLRRPKAWMLALLAVSLSTPCMAASPASLRQAEKDLKNAKATEQELEKKSKGLEKELADLQAELASNATRLQTTEAELESIEEKLVILQSQLDEKTMNLEKKRQEIAAMLAALVRLSGTPPEAAIMMPGDFETTLRAARTMESVSANLKTETASLRTQLEELEALKLKVNHSGELAHKKREAFAKRQKELEAGIAERQNLQKTLYADRTQQAEKIAKLSKQASSIRELINTIASKEEEKEETPAFPTSTPKLTSAKEMRSFKRAKGNIHPPTRGKLLRAFGVALSVNETTRGLTFQTPSDATILAPYDGEVMFAGNFLNYGKLIILRHTDGYHSLLSGFTRLSVRPGQFLLEGEPIGGMGGTKSGRKLYYELRAENQPVDPQPWLSSRD